ncbi:MAG: hypothetical protein QHD01_05880 [Bradyrhizobium sp.]|uniref:hypothetical protein n=1 Tax=Bradyrhizobium sp. TaxID=376 RepID=UPI0029A5EDFC|nr:hypothetical protein [Bradyrhizobium sp.]MDX3966114.1 hypothetical protein [Bradyrhizobium sp.]
MRAGAALGAGDSMVARRHLATLDDVAIRDEIDALIRAGLNDDAMHRLHLFTHPKFRSVDDCEAHVGSEHHYRITMQGSLL